ncbi:MAG TPA: hypothetical protein VJ250_01240 [Nitrososphaeraceae archaeon]|nr:hypothetical protein [Nitrososphaeraceae archaeon]
MSKEMLSRKLTGDETLTTEPSIGIKTNKDKKKRGQLAFLLAVAVGSVALISINLLTPVAFYETGSSSIDDSTHGVAPIPDDMEGSATATDSDGVVIEDNGLTKSAQITIRGYSDSSYSTILSCSIDSFPAYCNGSPVTFSGLPPGEHVFVVVNSLNDEVTAQSFSWVISE